jgi:hypothetical protein
LIVTAVFLFGDILLRRRLLGGSSAFYNSPIIMAALYMFRLTRSFGGGRLVSRPFTLA